MSIGIIGRGAFGTFLATSLQTHGTPVHIWDKDDGEDKNLHQACESDILILAVPVGELEDVCELVDDFITDDTVVMDVCSTKVESEKMLDDWFDSYICTHPLTGPPSADEITEGDVLVVTSLEGPGALEAVEYFKSVVGMKIVRMTAEEHDERMSYMQAIPFFIAKTLSNVGILAAADDDPLITPSFRKLLEVAKIDAAHSTEVYESITGTVTAVQAVDDLWEAMEKTYGDLPNHV